MKYTLLEIVQRVLGSMDADEVSSISETPEANDVAQIVKSCYYDIVGFNNLDDHTGVFKLEASADNLKPTLMTKPDEVSRIDWIKYNVSDDAADFNWTPMRYADNEEFLYFQSMMSTDEANISSMTIPINGTNFSFKFYNDRMPSCFTVFDETEIVFDAFDLTIENTLTQARSMGYGQLIPTFSMTDNFIPDLDPRQFQLLINEVISTAFVEKKQSPNPRSESRSRKNQILAQKTRNDKLQADTSQKRITYGRK